MRKTTLAFLVASGILAAGEKKLMHCFAFTVIDTATEAEWKAFKDSTDALPGKIPGVSRVWHGKLRAPLSLPLVVDAAARKRVNAGETVTTEVRRLQRQHGVCMEMADEATLKSYTGNPAHKEWLAVYEKVRVAGTTTYDILGE
ncbi:MAG: hypothetical protein ACRD96_17090 [Bryobacteraceae bacterium]